MIESSATLVRANSLPHRFPGGSSRRQVLQAALAFLSLYTAKTARADDHGRINPPVAAPDIPLTLHDGRRTSLPALLEGRATAIQAMFTSCTTTCPIEGTIFRHVQELIPDQLEKGIQLVSLTIDPKRDTPEALTKWLERFRARPGWIAAASRPKDLATLRNFMGPGRGAADIHTTQVQLVNRAARLIWRTYELPEAEEIAGILRKI